MRTIEQTLRLARAAGLYPVADAKIDAYALVGSAHQLQDFADFLAAPDPGPDGALIPQSERADYQAGRAAAEAEGKGYMDAFYAIADALGIGASTESPQHVFESVMLPRIKALAAAALVPKADPSPLASMAQAGRVGPYEGKCQRELREAGKAYPRTCAICMLGPCQRGAGAATAPKGTP